MGRIRDAVRTLLHGSPQTEVARMRAEWSALQLEVVNVLEQLNAWAARQAKREAREAKRALEAENAAPEAPQLPTGAHPKAALYTRAMELKRGTRELRTQTG